MKAHKIITITTIILAIIIISIASFGGIYKLKEYKVVNVVPDYLLGMKFNNSRVANFTVSNEIAETKIYDKTYDNASCGEVVEYLKGKGPVVKTADASLIITSAKPENKKQISGVDLINGKFFKIGEKLC